MCKKYAEFVFANYMFRSFACHICNRQNKSVHYVFVFHVYLPMYTLLSNTFLRIFLVPKMINKNKITIWVLWPNPYKENYQLKCQTLFLTTKNMKWNVMSHSYIFLGSLSSLISVTICAVHGCSTSFGEQKANHPLMGTANTTPFISRQNCTPTF